MTHILRIISLLTFLVGHPDLTFADFVPHKRTELREGMTSYEVVQSWGAPLEKEEFETGRREKWHYGKDEVTFREGKVVSWSLPEDSPTGALTGTERSREAGRYVGEASVPAPHGAAPRTGGHSPEAEALLGEILQEIPSGSPDTSPASPSTSHSNEPKPVLRTLDASPEMAD